MCTFCEFDIVTIVSLQNVIATIWYCLLLYCGLQNECGDGIVLILWAHIVGTQYNGTISS